jgi:hypothetical protein
MTAAQAIAAARKAGVGVDVIGGVLVMSGPRVVVAVWRPRLKRHREAIIELLAPAAPAPAQAVLPGLRR